MSEPGAVAFTDIVGFTEFCALRGDDEAVALLSLQERIVRDALPPGARIVKELGDGLLLWFPTATASLTTCLDLQDSFERESQDPLLPLWVRIGLHWGRPAARGDDLVGHDINVTARRGPAPVKPDPDPQRHEAVLRLALERILQVEAGRQRRHGGREPEQQTVAELLDDAGAGGEGIAHEPFLEREERHRLVVAA